MERGFFFVFIYLSVSCEMMPARKFNPRVCEVKEARDKEEAWERRTWTCWWIVVRRFSTCSCTMEVGVGAEFAFHHRFVTGRARFGGNSALKEDNVDR